jgi:outer membrane protein TolC
MVGPDYHRPAAILSLHYKELAGWVPARPADIDPKGAWWTIYNDPLLNKLESRVVISNQNVVTYAAQLTEAEAVVQETRGELFPTLGATASVTRTHVGNGSSGTGGFGTVSSGNTTTGSTTGTSSNTVTGGTLVSGSTKSVTRTEYNLEGTASWELDLWGRIRRQIQSDVAAAQVSAADLQNAALSAQGTLAMDYVELRYEDSLLDLLQATVRAYQNALRITHNQVVAGITCQCWCGARAVRARDCRAGRVAAC